MIQSLCNLVDDTNLETFYKVTIIEASKLPVFNNLTPKEQILGIINSLPNSFQAMVLPLLPEKLGLTSGSDNTGGNSSFNHSISFPLVPQDAAIKALLDTYNNKLVVVFLTRLTHSYLYGTQAQPLLFSYDELHAPGPQALKGYTLSQRGRTYGSSIYFEGNEASFPVVNRGLAFKLAGSI